MLDGLLFSHQPCFSACHTQVFLESRHLGLLNDVAYESVVSYLFLVPSCFLSWEISQMLLALAG